MLISEELFVLLQHLENIEQRCYHHIKIKDSLLGKKFCIYYKYENRLYHVDYLVISDYDAFKWYENDVYNNLYKENIYELEDYTKLSYNDLKIIIQNEELDSNETIYNFIDSNIGWNLYLDYKLSGSINNISKYFGYDSEYKYNIENILEEPKNYLVIV